MTSYIYVTVYVRCFDQDRWHYRVGNTVVLLIIVILYDVIDSFRNTLEVVRVGD